ncbi:SRPBCC family protein [Microbacterium sp. GXF6406]
MSVAPPGVALTGNTGGPESEYRAARNRNNQWRSRLQILNPRRVPEWDPGIASITVPEYNGAATGMAWEARSVTERRHDGKPIRMKPEAVRQQVELTHLEPDHAIAWRFTYPDAPHSNARHVRIDLAPAAGGTQLRLTLQWERRPGTKRRRIRGFILRPAHRFIVWLQLTQLTAEISRVYR